MPAGWVFWPATNRSISSRIPGGYNSCWTSRCIRQRPQRHGRGVWTREVRDQISTWLADTVPDPVGQPPPDPKVGREQQRRGRCHRPCPARSRVGVTRQLKPACNASTGVRQAGCRRVRGWMRRELSRRRRTRASRADHCPTCQRPNEASPSVRRGGPASALLPDKWSSPRRCPPPDGLFRDFSTLTLLGRRQVHSRISCRPR